MSGAATVGAALRRVVAAPVSRGTVAEVAWVLLGVPVSLACVVLLVPALLAGVALTPVLLGTVLVPGVLLAARGLGDLHRRAAGTLLGVRVARPPAAVLEPGLWQWITGYLRDGVAWRGLAYLLVRLPVSILQLAVTTTLVLWGAGTLSYPVLWFALDGALMPIFDIHTSTWPPSLLLALAGLFVLLAVPWVVHLLTGIDRLLARGLLGPTTLSGRVAELEHSRASAVQDATLTLRRVERDLHDGPQARLVALAMKLGMAVDELAGDRVDLGQVRTLVGGAHGNAKQVLAELRDLARGIRPAGLDAGLDVALGTLATDSSTPVRVAVTLPSRPSPAIETIVYFSAAELLANATKHGAPSLVRIEVTASDGTLRLDVHDDGAGGARMARGGGLAGLAERVGTVDGTLSITSPRGGPTLATVRIPLEG